jgi:hypothetical protein
MSYKTPDENHRGFAGLNGRYAGDGSVLSGAPSGFSRERHAFVGEAISWNHTQPPGPVFRFQCTTGCPPFPPFVCQNHDTCESKRTSAYCYEAFALRVAGHSPEKLVVDRCAVLKK